jgi:integrase
VGTIVQRRRSNGTTAYMAKIVLKSEGRVVHRESRTFDRRAVAVAWLARRETEIRDNGHAPPAPTVTLAEAIERYRREAVRPIGRTKDQVLTSIQRDQIASMDAAEIRSQDIVAFAQRLASDRQPQTVGNYLSHLSSLFQIARPAWGIPLDPTEMQAARAVAARLGITSKSNHRDRRPTIEEITRLVGWFQDRAPQSAPMHRIVMFALFSTRRQDEILRLRWDDLEPGRVMVRAMKHPGGTRGNDVWCDLPAEAEAIARSMPRRDERIFPFTTDAVSAAFTRACRVLGIEDLHFHDLRHEGITRLFEMGLTIPHVAAVSGHRSWQSLQRYTHVRQTGDRWQGFDP